MRDAARTLFLIAGPTAWAICAWCLYDLVRIARRSR
jgi:hypothetical protein